MDTATNDNADTSGTAVPIDDPDAAFLQLISDNTRSALPDGEILLFTATSKPPSGGNPPSPGNIPDFIVDDSDLQSFNDGNSDSSSNIFTDFEIFSDDLQFF